MIHVKFDKLKVGMWITFETDVFNVGIFHQPSTVYKGKRDLMVNTVIMEQNALIHGIVIRFKNTIINKRI